ncbi:MAG TPA: AI-2E family transporter [Gemmatimonadaceae bacterium]|nr:AI-2E family transporter [Gemmatimonadaceae bacterium]
MRDGSAETADDRRHMERRRAPRVADLTLPELRRILITSALFVVVLLLFLWMVRAVIIAAILAIVAAIYLRPLYERIRRGVPPTPAALLTITALLVPIAAATVYSWVELRQATAYLAAHQGEVIARIDAALHRVPLLGGASFTDQIRRMVLAASDYGAHLAEGARSAMTSLAVGSAIFLFTLAYALTDHDAIRKAVRSKVPARYGELVGALVTNVRGVLYGAVYATLVTQTIKSIVILGMNLAFDVPLAVVLAILSFVIGFFPIVGSWSVYVPVALWLIIFRDAWGAAIAMLVIGFLGNTLFISMYVRPKLAAEKSRVLNFYWMFVGLVTGVYTFGLVGILLGPVLIGLLKAVIDTITASGNWRMLGAGEDDDAAPPLAGASAT